LRVNFNRNDEVDYWQGEVAPDGDGG